MTAKDAASEPASRTLRIPLAGGGAVRGGPAAPVGEPDPTVELEALLRLAEAVLASREPTDVGEALLDSVVGTYGLPRGAVVAGEPRMSLMAAHGLSADAVSVGTSAAVERAFEQGGPVVAAVDPAVEPWVGSWLPAGSEMLVLPLQVDARRLGALVVQLPLVWGSEQRRYVARQLTRAAGTAASGLFHAQRLGQLQRLAATDDLTKIANRRSFAASLERELARSARRREPVSLVILDVDHFKQVNDVHGHVAGDEALRNVAAALTVACREFDIPARYGGEEFAVILPDCDAETSVAIADRLRAAIAAAPAVRSLTASAGVATFPAHASDGDQLIEAADAALLLAKRNGRDRTVVSDTRPPTATTETAPFRSGMHSGVRDN